MFKLLATLKIPYAKGCIGHKHLNLFLDKGVCPDVLAIIFFF